MNKALKAWQELNERQQLYLKAVFDIDQEKENSRRLDAAQGRWDHTPASEWRWIRYYSAYGPSRLQQAIGADHIDQGTGSTFEALEKRGLIEARGSFNRYDLFVKMTTPGRAAVRAGLNIESNSKPAGLLAKKTWIALKLAYEAGEAGVEGASWSATYGGIIWEVWLRLRNHKSGEMVEEVPRTDTIRITEAGRILYESRLNLHRREYPDLYERREPRQHREPRTYEEVAAERQQAGKPAPQRCPHCKNGAGILFDSICDPYVDIDEFVYECSYCAKGWSKVSNPYTDQDSS